MLRVTGAYAATIQQVLPEAYVAESFEQAVSMSRRTSAPVATLEGDVLRGPHVVSGGPRLESRGILATKGEIKELRERNWQPLPVDAKTIDAVVLTHAHLDHVAGVAAVKAAMETQKYKDAIAADQQLATKLGATGTPAFFINGRMISGARPFEAFKEVIDDELSNN